MNFKDFVFSIFSGLSRLYPKEYQQKYSEDMKSVFREILEDSGGWHAIHSFLRECVCLPVCLFREYLHAKGDDRMKSTRQVFSASIIGFISMYLLLGIQQGTIIAFYGYATLQSPGINVLMLLTGGVLSGVLVGGAIDYALSIKNKAAMMVICGLAYLVPNVLLNPAVLGLPKPLMDEGWNNFLIFTSSPFCGFCFGMVVGFLGKGWKTGIAFGLASGLIFTTGWWIFYAAQSFVLGQGIDWIVDANTLSAKLRVLIYYSVSFLLYGAIIGILWGILLNRLPRVKSLNFSSAGT
jgi:hypothetical protein